MISALLSLHGSRADTQAMGDRLIGSPIEQSDQHIMFTGGQGGEPLSNRPDFYLARQPTAGIVERARDGGEQGVAGEGLLQQVHRPLLHDLNRQGHIRIGRRDDDRNGESPPP